MSSTDREALIETMGSALMRWQDATQRFDEAVGEIYGLNASERLCLSFLSQGTQTASAIARQVRLTPAAVTTLIDRLERRGYVRRKADPDDRRKVMVEAAEQTHRLTLETYLPVREASTAMLMKYSEAELRAVERVLMDALTLQDELTEQLLARHHKS